MEQILVQTLVQIGVALISLAGAYVIYLIGKAKAKVTEMTAKEIADENQRKLVNDAIERVSTLANTVVAQTEQVSASALREAVYDGKIDKAELEVLGKQAVDAVYSQLSADTKALLEKELTDVKAYVESVVEAEVLKLKMK